MGVAANPPHHNMTQKRRSHCLQDQQANGPLYHKHHPPHINSQASYQLYLDSSLVQVMYLPGPLYKPQPLISSTRPSYRGCCLCLDLSSSCACWSSKATVSHLLVTMCLLVFHCLSSSRHHVPGGLLRPLPLVFCVALQRHVLYCSKGPLLLMHSPV
jgi:hypothetical protein